MEETVIESPYKVSDVIAHLP